VAYVTSTYGTQAFGAWEQWNYTVSTTTSSPVIVWDSWVGNAATTYDTSLTWDHWVTTTSTTTFSNNTVGTLQFVERPRDPRSIIRGIALKWALDTWDAAIREDAERERVRAEERAEVLLREVLDEAQLAQLEQHGHVEVTAASGVRYRLRRGWAGNVDVVHKPRGVCRARRYCIHPRTSVPVADNLVAQLLMLRNDEEQFLRTANAA